MRRRFGLAFFLTAASLAVAQVAPGPVSNPSQQPGTSQYQPGTDPNAPYVVAGAPPAFAPGVGVMDGNAPTSNPRVVRISGGVMASSVVTKVDPAYPESARAAHMSGSVVMSARIGKDGRVANLAVVSGPQIFQRPAIDAVKQWTYRPYLLNGRPVEVETVVTVNFSLQP